MVRRTSWLLGSGIGLLALGALIDSRPWNWPWQSVWSGLVAHIALIGLGLPAVGLLTIAAVSRRRTHAAKTALADTSPGPKWHWLLTYPGVATVAVTVAVIGVAALVIMLKVAANATATNRPTLQIDAIKYGLGLFAAGAAAAALLLGVRRQQHSENAQAHTELDAAERRVTDLYTKAVEQLGHTEAAVRLGGLYALERVAQNNVRQRQPIVNVLCAYLRMPYTPPAAEPTAAPASPTTLVELPLNQSKPTTAGGRDPHQELQVRLTAQRIITSHLTLPSETNPEQAKSLRPDPQQPFWPDIDIDLTGATLVGWGMPRSRVHHAEFGEAVFSGDAGFGEAVFSGVAWFGAATFSRGAWFGAATFSRGAGFGKAVFFGVAEFDEATFSGDARFSEVTTPRSVQLVGCRVLLRDDRRDVWPPGWRLEPDTDGMGKLIYQAPPALPGP